MLIEWLSIIAIIGILATLVMTYLISKTLTLATAAGSDTWTSAASALQTYLPKACTGVCFSIRSNDQSGTGL